MTKRQARQEAIQLVRAWMWVYLRDGLPSYQRWVNYVDRSIARESVFHPEWDMKAGLTAHYRRNFRQRTLLNAVSYRLAFSTHPYIADKLSDAWVFEGHRALNDCCIVYKYASPEGRLLLGIVLFHIMQGLIWHSNTATKKLQDYLPPDDRLDVLGRKLRHPSVELFRRKTSAAMLDRIRAANIVPDKSVPMLLPSLAARHAVAHAIAEYRSVAKTPRPLAILCGMVMMMGAITLPSLGFSQKNKARPTPKQLSDFYNIYREAIENARRFTTLSEEFTDCVVSRKRAATLRETWNKMRASAEAMSDPHTAHYLQYVCPPA